MWYLQKKGRTEGPIPDATLMHAIDKGEIGPLDLLFKEGEERWRAAAEYAELRERFQSTQVTNISDEDEWIILSKVKETRSFKQKGPFKTSEVKNKLKTGEVLWSDYAWRDGMKEWYRVTALEIFHGTPSTLPDDLIVAPLPKVSRKSALEKVETLQRPSLPTVDERPSEAVGPDLTQKVNAQANPKATVKGDTKGSAKANSAKANGENGEEKKPKKQAKKQPPQVEPEMTQTQIQNPVIFSRRLSLWDRFREMSPSQRWWVSAGISTAVVALAVITLFYSSYRDYIELQLRAKKTKSDVTQVRDDQEEVRASKRGATPAPALSLAPAEPAVENLPDKAPQVAETPPVKKEEKVMPTQLKVVVRNNRSAAPRLEVQTNGSSHYPIALKITGRLASVVGTRSYFRQISVKTAADRKIELSKYSIKPGYYDVTVEFNGEKKLMDDANLEVAISEKDFRSELYNYRKSLSHWATTERVQLIKLTARAEEQLDDFIKQYPGFKDKSSALKTYIRSWQKRFEAINSQTLRAINNRNRNNYVYAENWLELKALKLNTFEQTAALARAKDPAQVEQEFKDLRALKGDLSRFKEKVISSSIFR